MRYVDEMRREEIPFLVFMREKIGGMYVVSARISIAIDRIHTYSLLLIEGSFFPS
jgi:hypothetical protein